MILPKLAFFLATQDQFFLDVKKMLATLVTSHEDVLQDMINLCIDRFESGEYLLPSTKFTYLKAMAVAIPLLDGEGDEKDITKRKKFKLDKLGKIFKSNPFVPLFGDIVISLPQIYNKAPHIANAKWESLENDEEGKAQLKRTFQLATYIEEQNTSYRDYIVEAKKTFINVIILVLFTRLVILPILYLLISTY